MLFGWVCLVFLLLMEQAPLYTSNQNTKFLHGAAQAGWGDLRHDWLAGTKDGLPLFSVLVHAMHAWLSPYMAYAVFAALTAVCFFSLEGILRRTFGVTWGSRRHAWLCASLAIVLACCHDAYAGVAGQYMLGTYLQPCVFGVFVLLSVRWFLERREAAASTALALASIMHPAYLFPAAVLLVAYGVELRRDGRGWKAHLATYGPFLVCISANLIYLGLVFRPTSPELFEQAVRILAVKRIPHHSLVSVWAGPGAYGKLALALAAVYLLRGKPLGRLLGWLTAASLLLTLLQAMTGSKALALVAPWRASVVIVPLALFSLIAWLLLRLSEPTVEALSVERKRLHAIFGLLFVVLAVRGVVINLEALHAYRARPEMAVLRWIRDHKQAGDVYCIPIRDPAFEKFRLETGAPVFVNWKSHPYKDVEVLEWDARIALAEELEKSSQAELASVLDRLRAHDRVTHILVRQPAPWSGVPGLEHVFTDSTCILFRIATKANEFS